MRPACGVFRVQPPGPRAVVLANAKALANSKARTSSKARAHAMPGDTHALKRLPAHDHVAFDDSPGLFEIAACFVHVQSNRMYLVTGRLGEAIARDATNVHRS